MSAMSDTKQTVLVTGAAGFVGSAVAVRLAGMGYTVVGCDNFNDYYDPALKRHRVEALLGPAGVPCENVELSDAAQTEVLFDRVQPSLVVHLAAQAGVRYSLQNPAVYVQANMVAFGHILEACRKHKTAHMVYASSSSVYGANAKTPFSESDQTDTPVSLYAATKKANELMAHTYSHLYGLPITGLRFFTVYGPWGRPDMAYFSFAKKMLAGEKIPVFAEGKLYRDFTYIDDIVEGVVRLLLKPSTNTEGKPPHAIFNIGNSTPVQVLDFIRTLEGAFNVKAELDFQPMQPGDVPATHADTSKLQDWVGYKPTTSLASGLGEFARWYNQATRENVSYLK
jgi:UDP-glucuronate 4-epimerase